MADRRDKAMGTIRRWRQTRDGCVAKNMLGHKNTERHFSSGGAIEEIGHESSLSANVAFPDPFNLSLPDQDRDGLPSLIRDIRFLQHNRDKVKITADDLLGNDMEKLPGAIYPMIKGTK